MQHKPFKGLWTRCYVDLTFVTSISTISITPPTTNIPRPHIFLPSFYTWLCQDSRPTQLTSDLYYRAPYMGRHLHPSLSQHQESSCRGTLLVHLKPNALINLATDASDSAIGAVLQQYINGQQQPISFFFKKMKPSENRYNFDRELLAVYLSIKHFQYFLEGRTFHVIMDHKLLTVTFNASPDRHSPQQCCHLDFISQFTKTHTQQCCRRLITHRSKCTHS